LFDLGHERGGTRRKRKFTFQDLVINVGEVMKPYYNQQRNWLDQKPGAKPRCHGKRRGVQDLLAQEALTLAPRCARRAIGVTSRFARSQTRGYRLASIIGSLSLPNDLLTDVSTEEKLMPLTRRNFLIRGSLSLAAGALSSVLVEAKTKENAPADSRLGIGAPAV